MKPGWRTSEMSFGLLAGIAISEVASQPCATIPDAVVRSAACLSLALIALAYTRARARVKGAAE